MKICYLSDASSVHTKKWCDYFLKEGYDIMVISLGDGSIPGVRVYSLGIQEFRKKSDLLKLSYVNKIFKIKKILKTEKPDILHAQYATSYGLLAALSGYRPYLLSLWGSDIYDFPLKSILHRWILQYNLSKADTILSTSDDMRKMAKKYTDKKILVTPFGVNVNKFKPMEVKRSPNFTVGTVKSFYPNYGIEYLIKGFYLFQKEVGNKEMRLLLAGKGSQEGELRKLVRDLEIDDQVQFLGFLNEEQVIETFNKMDVAVFPSINESFGVAAVEAQACGIPTIVSNVGGLPEATSPNYSSIVVEKENEQEIADALFKLYRDADLRQQMKRNARQYVLDHYNISDNFNAVNEIYKAYERKEAKHGVNAGEN